MMNFVFLKCILLLQICWASQTYYENYQCNECLAKGGRQCLLPGDWTWSLCCNPDYDKASPYCQSLSQTAKSNAYCATSKTIKNPLLQPFFCPSRKGWTCPSRQSEIDIRVRKPNTQDFRFFAWTREKVPQAEATDWHCKYKISPDDAYVSKIVSEKVLVDIQFFGFDDYVHVILQKRNRFRDVVLDQPIEDIQAIYVAQNGSRFIIPGEYDVIITFAPVANRERTFGTSHGAIKLVVEMRSDEQISDEDRAGDHVIETYRPGENVTVIEEKTPEAPDLVDPEEPTEPPKPNPGPVQPAVAPSDNGSHPQPISAVQQPEGNSSSLVAVGIVLTLLVAVVGIVWVFRVVLRKNNKISTEIRRISHKVQDTVARRLSVQAKAAAKGPHQELGGESLASIQQETDRKTDTSGFGLVVEATPARRRAATVQTRKAQAHDLIQQTEIADEEDTEELDEGINSSPVHPAKESFAAMSEAKPDKVGSKIKNFDDLEFQEVSGFNRQSDDVLHYQFYGLSDQKGLNSDSASDVRTGSHYSSEGQRRRADTVAHKKKIADAQDPNNVKKSNYVEGEIKIFKTPDRRQDEEFDKIFNKFNRMLNAESEAGRNTEEVNAIPQGIFTFDKPNTIKRAHNQLQGASIESDGISELYLTNKQKETPEKHKQLKDKLDEGSEIDVDHYMNMARLALEINKGRGFTVANRLLAQVNCSDAESALGKSMKSSDMAQSEIDGFSTFTKSGVDWNMLNHDGSQRKMTELERRRFEQLVKESRTICEEMKQDEVRKDQEAEERRIKDFYSK